MFFHDATIKKGGRFYMCYIAGVLPRKFSFISDPQIINCDYLIMCDDLKEVITSESNQPCKRYSLRLSSQLLFGLIKIHLRKVNILHVDVSKFESNLIKCYHSLIREKRPRQKRPKPAIQNGITKETNNLRAQENESVMVRNINDITIEDVVLADPRIINDNFGEMPQLATDFNDPMNMIQDQILPILEQDNNPVIEPEIIPNIVVPEIHIEPPKENRKRKATDAPQIETVRPNPDSVTTASSESIQDQNNNRPRRVNARRQEQVAGMEYAAVIALERMEKYKGRKKPGSENLSVDNVSEQFEILGRQFDTINLPDLPLNITQKIIHVIIEPTLNKFECYEMSDVSDDESIRENIIEVMEVDPQCQNIELIPNDNTNLPNDSLNTNMQGNNTVRAPDVSRDENRTSLLLPNINYDRTFQGSILPDTTQLQECGNLLDVPDVTVRHSDIPMEPFEISEVPNSTTDVVNTRNERTLITEDSFEVREEVYRILSENWDPKPLFLKIVRAQENGETDVDIEKIVKQDFEATALVTPRRAIVRAFASLLKLKESRCVHIEKKLNSTEIKHISIDLDNSEEY